MTDEHHDLARKLRALASNQKEGTQKTSSPLPDEKDVEERGEESLLTMQHRLLRDFFFQLSFQET